MDRRLPSMHWRQDQIKPFSYIDDLFFLNKPGQFSAECNIFFGNTLTQYFQGKSINPFGKQFSYINGDPTHKSPFPPIIVFFRANYLKTGKNSKKKLRFPTPRKKDITPP